MTIEVTMPQLSDTMEEGTILRWLKSVGDDVAAGDELVEIETDKANMVYESDAAGTLIEILRAEDEPVPTGAVIARIGDASASAAGHAEVDGNEATADEASRESEGASDDASAVPATVAPGRRTPVKASPVARRMARERNVDLAGLVGSGPGGRIVKADVERATGESPPVAAQPEGVPRVAGDGGLSGRGDVEIVELTRLEATVARRMAESKAAAPHFYLEAEIDMSRAVAARATLKTASESGEVVPSFNDMVIKAVAQALRKHPRANGAYRDGRLELYSRVNVGLAVAARNALVVPTIFDADSKGLLEIATTARALAQGVREGTVTPPELSGGTFTVTNLGMFGIANFGAVINPPQAGILAVGEIVEKPVVRAGAITTAHMMGVNLACDHRILSGADGAQFLGMVRSLLEEPMALAL